MRGQPPLVERYIGAFKDGAHRDGELALAFVAVVEARTRRTIFPVLEALRGSAVTSILEIVA